MRLTLDLPLRESAMKEVQQTEGSCVTRRCAHQQLSCGCTIFNTGAFLDVWL